MTEQEVAEAKLAETQKRLLINLSKTVLMLAEAHKDLRDRLDEQANEIADLRAIVETWIAAGDRA